MESSQPIRPRFRRSICLIPALLALACASALSERDVEVRLRSAAGSVRGLPADPLLVPIHADSKVAAWTLLAEARAEGPSAMGERLSYDLRREAKRRRSVVVGGAYSDLTRETLLEALDLVEGESLRGLTLVYVGEAVHAGELRRVARARQARFYHRELP